MGCVTTPTYTQTDHAHLYKDCDHAHLYTVHVTTPTCTQTDHAHLYTDCDHAHLDTVRVTTPTCTQCFLELVEEEVLPGVCPVSVSMATCSYSVTRCVC